MGKLVDEIKRLQVVRKMALPRWTEDEGVLEAIDNWIDEGYVRQVFQTRTALYEYLCGASADYPREPIWTVTIPAYKTFIEFMRKRAADVHRKSAQRRNASKAERAGRADSSADKTA